MKPRRRRLTIAALVLLLLGGGLWWSTRPKIDPRLVGRWTVDGVTPLTITSDGLMTSFYGSMRTDGAEVFHLRFRMRGQNFEVVDISDSMWDRLKQTLETLIWKTPEPIPHRGTIVDITSDSFRLNVAGHGTCEYRRAHAKQAR